MAAKTQYHIERILKGMDRCLLCRLWRYPCIHCEPAWAAVGGAAGGALEDDGALPFMLEAWFALTRGSCKVEK